MQRNVILLLLLGALGVVGCGKKERMTAMDVIILMQEADSMVVQVNESVPFDNDTVLIKIDEEWQPYGVGGRSSKRFALGKTSRFGVRFYKGKVPRKTSNTLFWLENHSEHEVTLLMFPFGDYKNAHIGREDYHHVGISYEDELRHGFAAGTLYDRREELLKKLEGTPYVQTFAPGEHKAFELDAFDLIKNSREE